jgi:serine O-acetyltransferase
MRGVKAIVLVVWQLPLVLASRWPAVRAAVDRDVRRALQPRLDLPLPESYSLGELARVLRLKPVRSVLYARLALAGPPARFVAIVLRALWRPEPVLIFACRDIGPGLFLEHGFASVITAQRIGTDCQLSQQVTIGYSDHGGPPVLGDRVRVGASAVIIGPVTVGDDAVVGAGAVVVQDVPAGAVVGGVPARVLAGARDRFSARRRLPGA